MNKTGYKKGLTILIHAAVWILLFSLPTLLRPGNDRPEPENSAAIFWVARFTDFLLVCFFYLNAGILMVRLFYKKKYFFYILSVLVCFAAFSFLSGEANYHFNNLDNHFTIRRHLVFCIFVF